MVRVRGGWHALVLTLLLGSLAAACGGSVREDSTSAPASGGGGGASVAGSSGGVGTAGTAGTPTPAGGSTSGGGGGGSAGDAPCVGSPEPCVSSCDLTNQPAAFQVCQNGAWQCAAGVDESKCPNSACSSQNVRCCDEASAAPSAAGCDLSGTPICAPGSDAMPTSTPCAVKPVVCRGASVATLQGQPCTLGDPQCDFGYGTGMTFCSCQMLASVEPTWSCGGLAR
jgi:hypothetical protein